MTNLIGVFDGSKDYFYYRMVGFCCGLAITVLAIISSVNANILSQYNEEYNIYNPFDFMRLANDQFLIARNAMKVPIRLDSTNINTDDYSYLFLVDRTSSVTQEQEDLLPKTKEMLVKSIQKRSRYRMASELEGLRVSELLCLEMVFNIYKCQAGKIIPDLTAEILFYDGEIQGDLVFNILTLNAPVSKDCRNLPNYYRSLINDFLSNDNRKRTRVCSNDYGNNDRSRSLEDRTNFAEIFGALAEIIGALKEMFGERSKKTIITMFSDFHHDISDYLSAYDACSLEDVSLETVEKKILDLIRISDIFQLSIIRIPRRNGSENTENEIKELVDAIKSNFNNSIVYHIDSPSLDEEEDIVVKLAEVITPTFKSKDKVYFYHPFTNANLGANNEARAKILLKHGDELNNVDCLFSIHSQEGVDPKHDGRLSLFISDIKYDNITHRYVLGFNKSVRQTCKKDKSVGVVFNNTDIVKNGSRLFLNIFSIDHLVKLRVPLLFRERLVEETARMISGLILFIIASFLLFILFFVGDWIVHKILLSSVGDTEKKKRFLFLMPIFFFVVILYVIYSIKQEYLSDLQGEIILPVIVLSIITLFVFQLYTIFLRTKNWINYGR